MTSSIYNYVNNAKVWLPMTSATNDPVNLRTLDVSGNGLHYRFGDGVNVATYPTKVSGQRGYSFDGSSDYLEALVNQTNIITAATWVWFGKLSRNVDSQDLVSHFDAVNTRMLFISNAASVAFYTGDLTNFCFVNSVSYQPIGQALFIAGTTKVGDTRKLYVNGFGPFTNALGTLAPGVPATLPRIGVRYNNTRYLQGSTFFVGHWEYALTELQLRDLEARLRRQLNDV